jgi:RNA polymerase sigma-70 factor, ECF subfamily
MIAPDTVKGVFPNRLAFDREARRQAFETAALPYLGDLFRTTTRLLRNRSEAEDMVQETYLQAWRSFHRFEAATDCRAWLFAVMFNVIGHQRRRWARFREETNKGLEQTLRYTPPIPEELQDEDILTALDAIPSGFRAVVLLADVQEFSYREIAGILSVPIGTVMSRLSRGRELLRTALGDLAHSYGINKVQDESGSRA